MNTCRFYKKRVPTLISDRKSTRLNSSHLVISYAVFCLKKKTELAYYVAKVLHPRTMVPLVDKKIPLYVRSAFADGPGTRIADDVGPAAYAVNALTAVHS